MSVGTAAVVIVALATFRRRPLENALILAGVAVAAAGSGLAGLGYAATSAFASYSPHSGAANISLSDGSVRFIPSSSDPGSWRATGTQDGGEVISDY